MLAATFAYPSISGRALNRTPLASIGFALINADNRIMDGVIPRGSEKELCAREKIEELPAVSTLRGNRL
jgi:hypothetical protein